MDKIIWQHFLEMMLVEKYTFDQIRVREICQRVKIHRSTFYRHFEDKYQLLEYGLEILWNDYFELEDKDKFLRPFQTATQFFENSTAEKLIKRNHVDDEFIKFVDDFFLKKMNDSFINSLSKEEVTAFPHDLLALYLISSIQSIDEWARRQKEKISAKELDDIYQKLALKVLKVD